MTASEKYRVCSIHARFIQALLPLLFIFFDWKTSKWAYHLLQFFISYWKSFWNPSSLLHNLLYCFELVFVHKYIFCLPQWLFFLMACLLSHLLSRFSVLITLFCDLAIFFLYTAVFHVFHGPGFLGSKSRVWVQVLEVAQL